MALAPHSGAGVRLEDVPRHGCHWPLGDPKASGFGFCGRPASEPPYCKAHRRMAYPAGKTTRARPQG